MDGSIGLAVPSALRLRIGVRRAARRANRWQVAHRTQRRVLDEPRLSRALDGVGDRFDCRSGSAVLVDCLPLEERSDPEIPRQVFPHEVIVRIVRGLTGRVTLTMLYEPRFDYGYVVPWMRREDDAVEAIEGPDALVLRADVPLDIDGGSVTASFEVTAGRSVGFIAAYRLSYARPETAIGTDRGEHFVEVTNRYWRDWTERSVHEGPWQEQVARSLLTLKALTYSPTGGIVAAATTSLPDRRIAKLGLPVLVAAGRHLHAGRPARSGLHGGGRGVESLAAARRGRRPQRPADHVRRVRREAPRRD